MALQEKTQEIIDSINQFATPEVPQTVRACYYHLVTAGILPSSDKSYQKVKRVIADARRSGRIAYPSIVDNGRSAEHPSVYASVAERAQLARFIKLNPWRDQENYVEVIAEKDAASHLIYPVCRENSVSYRSLRGDTSLSFAYETAKHYSERILEGQLVHVGYWGDFDAGGWSIGLSAEKTIREILSDQFCITSGLHWKRLGISKDDFDTYDMLPIPCKSQDTKVKAFLQEFGIPHGAEIDALPAEVIKERTQDFIDSCKDQEMWSSVSKENTSEELRWHQAMDSLIL